MVERLTTMLLQECADAAEAKMKLAGRINDAMRERYGCTHSDVDCEDLIEVLDYHGGEITLDECDRAMLRAGAPKVKGRPANA